MFAVSQSKVDYFFDRFLDPSSIAAEDNGPRGLIGVIGKPGELEAAMMLGIDTFWYTTQPNLDEYWACVDPDHRKSNHSKALVGYAKNIVNELLPIYADLRLIIGILSVKRTAAKVRLYGQQVQPAGGYFTWPPIEEIDGEPLKRLYKKQMEH